MLFDSYQTTLISCLDQALDCGVYGANPAEVLYSVVRFCFIHRLAYLVVQIIQSLYIIYQTNIECIGFACTAFIIGQSLDYIIKIWSIWGSHGVTRQLYMKYPIITNHHDDNEWKVHYTVFLYIQNSVLSKCFNRPGEANSSSAVQV